MLSSITTILALAATFTTGASIPKRSSGDAVMVTPHDSYSASIGVIGCKIDVNRAAYFPTAPGCDNLCYKFTHSGSGRTLTLLHLDRSGGAHDISYDAWNYLVTGHHVKDAPKKATYGGGVAMTYESVDMSECKDILDDGKLPFISGNPDFVTAQCLPNKPNSWVAKNYQLWNIRDQRCNAGIDEVCKYDPSVSNQAQCPGTGKALKSDMAVKDVSVVQGQKNVADGSVAPAS